MILSGLVDTLAFTETKQQAAKFVGISSITLVWTAADQGILAGIANEDLIDVGREGEWSLAGQVTLFEGESFGGSLDGYDIRNQF